MCIRDSSYTDLINIYGKEDKQKLRVFARNGVYLPTKKIGKNNPKAEQIRTDNQYRTMWNQTVDRAVSYTHLDVYKRQEELAWETEVWIAEMPEHMIHLNGDRFMGPR